jgi:hypothetical protein
MRNADGGGPADRAGTEADMGAQRSDGGHGHRPAHPDARATPGEPRSDEDASPACRPAEPVARDARATPGVSRSGDGGAQTRRPAGPGVQDAPAVEALLAVALRGGCAGAEGERRAVDAFRAARDAGAHRAARTARVRRRDDWRPRERRRARHSLRTTLSVVLASLTLGGVAYAAIGAGDADRAPAEGSPSAANGGPAPTAAPTGTGSAGRPAGPGSSAPPSDAAAGSGAPTAGRDLEAQCRAYERVEGRGRAMDPAAWQRLVAEAGGERRVLHPAAHTADGTHPRERREHRGRRERRGFW